MSSPINIRLFLFLLIPTRDSIFSSHSRLILDFWNNPSNYFLFADPNMGKRNVTTPNGEQKINLKLLIKENKLPSNFPSLFLSFFLLFWQKLPLCFCFFLSYVSLFLSLFLLLFTYFFIEFFILFLSFFFVCVIERRDKNAD